MRRWSCAVHGGYSNETAIAYGQAVTNRAHGSRLLASRNVPAEGFENTAVGTPERLHLETLFASLLSYGATTKLLTELLPLDEELNAVTIRNHLLKVAERSDAELEPEEVSFIEGCPASWAGLPIPDGPLTIGIDGGFIRDQRNKGWFEVIAGKSILEFRRDEARQNKSSKCFGFVQSYNDRPKRRLFELLKSQGMQENQQVVFLSDGGEEVRNLQFYLNPQAGLGVGWRRHIPTRSRTDQGHREEV